MRYPLHLFGDQRGAVAITAMIGMTLIMLTMGLALAEIAFREEAKSRNNYETEQAFAAASGCTEYALQMLKGNASFDSPYDAFGGGLVTGDTECFLQITPAEPPPPPTNGQVISQGKRGNKIRKIITDYNNAGPAPAALQLDVALVIDRSNSMIDPALENAKEGAKAFVDKLDFSDPDPTKRDFVTIVQFTDLTSKARLELELRNDPDLIKTRINGIDKNGETNIEHALYLAKEELKSSRAHPAAKKAVIFMSDGAANWRIDTLPDSMFGCTTCPLAGTSCLTAAQNMATTLESEIPGVEIFSIAYNLGTLVCPSGPPPVNAADSTKLLAELTLRAIASDPPATHYFPANNLDIKKVYEQIAGVLNWKGLYLSSWREE